MKKAIMFACFLACSYGVMAAELKECKSEEDKITGCVVKSVREEVDRKIYLEIPFKNGEIEGIYKEYYYENGNLKLEAPYKNDKQEGIAKDYYENGNLQGEVPYKNGKKEGMQKWYYEDGDIWAEVPYINGKLHGTIKFYNEKLLWQLSAQNGKILSGKCANGKAFTSAHISKLSKDFNEGIVGGTYWYQICGK